MFGLKTAVKMSRCIQVEWEDGLLARFNYLWLQDNSVRRPSLVHLDLNTKPEAVNYSREALNLVWPPYMASNYSSEFLRKNALSFPATLVELQPTTATAASAVEGLVASTSDSSNVTINNNNSPISSSPSSSTADLFERMVTDQYGNTHKFSIDSAQIWAIVDAVPISNKPTIGQCYWMSGPQEPGTIWPHLQSVPSICAVDTLNLNAAAELSIVDAQKALRILAERHPRIFEFMAEHMMEYSEGIFSARHQACSVVGGKIVPGVFNNAARSSTITAEPLEMFYESLQKFGRICAEQTQIIRLEPGKRLIIDNSKAMLGAPTQPERHLVLRCLQ